MPRFSAQIQDMFVKSFGQTQEDADRLKAIGAKNTACVGNIKFASAPLPVDEDELKRMREQIGGRACWTAGSTHAGEDGVIADVHKALKEKIPGVLTIVAPRHPNRADEIEGILKCGTECSPPFTQGRHSAADGYLSGRYDRGNGAVLPSGGGGFRRRINDSVRRTEYH